MNQIILLIFILFFFVLTIFLLMNFIYDKINYSRIQQYLLNCELIEKEILKDIINNKKKQIFPLTKDSYITKKFLNLNILSKLKDDEKNSLHVICFLNLKILNLINKNSKLKKIYLSSN